MVRSLNPAWVRVIQHTRQQPEMFQTVKEAHRPASVIGRPGLANLRRRNTEISCQLDGYHTTTQASSSRVLEVATSSRFNKAYYVSAQQATMYRKFGTDMQ